MIAPHSLAVPLDTNNKKEPHAYSGRMRLRLAERVVAGKAFEGKVKDC